MTKIKLNESDLEDLVKCVIAEGYDDSLPIIQPQGDIQVKYIVIQQVLQDLYKAGRYFESIKPSHDPIYSDKFNKLKRAIKSLEKLI